MKFTVSTQSSSISTNPSASNSTSIPILERNNNKVKPLSLEDQITKAEIYGHWTLRQKDLAIVLVMN